MGAAQVLAVNTGRKGSGALATDGAGLGLALSWAHLWRHSECTLAVWGAWGWAGPGPLLGISLGTLGMHSGGLGSVGVGRAWPSPGPISGDTRDALWRFGERGVGSPAVHAACSPASSNHASLRSGLPIGPGAGSDPRRHSEPLPAARRPRSSGTGSCPGRPTYLAVLASLSITGRVLGALLRENMHVQQQGSG